MGTLLVVQVLAGGALSSVVVALAVGALLAVDRRVEEREPIDLRTRTGGWPPA